MKHRKFSKVSALIVSMCFIAMSSVNVIPASASELRERAFDQLATCVRSEGATNLSLYFLIDTSASLSGSYDGIPASDPTDQRAKIISASIQQFAQLNDKIKVQFALGTFDKNSPGGNGKYTGFGWTEANSSNVEKKSKWVAEKIPTYDKGAATNWQRGLEEAQKSLSTAPRIGEGDSSCKAIIWFTDGAIDIAGGFNDASDANAIKALCGVSPDSNGNNVSSGIIPSLRRNGVTLIGVLLRPAVGQMPAGKKRDQVSSRVSFFQPIVEGSGQADSRGINGGHEHEFNCGYSNDPTYANGAMLEADNVNELAEKFAELYLMIASGDLRPLYSDSFTVEDGISKVSAVIPSADWKIELPNGEASITPDMPGSAFVNTVGEISTVSLKVSNKAHGNWKISHGNSPKPAIYFESGLVIKLDKNLVFQSNGKSQKISGTVIDASGKTPNLKVYSAASMSVTPLDASGLARSSKETLVKIDANGNWSGEVVPFDGLDKSILQVKLNVKTSKNELPSVKQTFTVPLTIPGQYCKTSSSNQKFNDLIYKHAAATATIKVTGSNLGTCSIAFSKPIVLSDPIGRTENDFTYALKDSNSSASYKFGEYITVEKGQSRDLTFEINSGSKADGNTDFRIPIKLNAPSAAAEINKTINGTFLNKTQKTGLWWIALIITLIGILIPIGLLHAVNRTFAKFRFEGIRYAVVPIIAKVNSGNVSIAPADDRSDILLPKNFNYVESQNPKEFEIFANGRNIAKLSAVTPRNPFGVIQGNIDAAEGLYIASSESVGVSNGLKAKSSLNPSKVFFVTASVDDIQNKNSDGDAIEFKADLTVFLNEESGSFDKQIPLVLDDIKNASFWSPFGEFLISVTPAVSNAEEASPAWTGESASESAESDPWASGSVSGSGVVTNDPWGADMSETPSKPKERKKGSKFSLGKSKENSSKSDQGNDSSSTNMEFDPDDPWA